MGLPFGVGTGRAEPAKSPAKATEAVKILRWAAARDSSAYGARNVQMVAAGTGEALPGPVVCGVCRRSDVPYNR